MEVMEEKPGRLLADIIYGIRESVKKAEPLLSDELEEKDYTRDAKITHNFIRELEDKKCFFFKDFAPKAFASIRKLLGVSANNFLESWAMSNEDSELSESTARSGSMFYTTDDRKYLFKTILHPEVKVMMEILQDYHKHLKDHPKSFIVRIYGLFRYMSGASKIWILIMGHIIPPTIPIEEKFDLKGRKPKPSKRSDRLSINDKLASVPQKDNEIDRVICFVDEHKDFYKRQLNDDKEMLKLHDIMDYSLLIGIHKVTEEEFEDAASVSARDDEYFMTLPMEIRVMISRHDIYIKIKDLQKNKKLKEKKKISTAKIRYKINLRFK